MLISSRLLAVINEINLSDAFIAEYLTGFKGNNIAEVDYFKISEYLAVKSLVLG